MKTAAIALVFLLGLCLTPAFAFTDEPVRPLTAEQFSLIEKNILRNLDCCCCEVRANTIQTIIDLKKAYPNENFDYAIIPLMSLLKSDNRYEVRILAALALYQYDSELAKFAISRRALYDSSERVAKHCATLIREWNNKHVPEVGLTASTN
jgi:hypothetical protein